ncbi:unnamed protein product (macronuclear) [Paramecium tetraurelia]|uniref:Homeobox domain-containing protein n=1 Tax=Paramecium tetraurelia TaxID=5888 RepID=A0CFK5_PARTE|nr:uncharacterized protein GSPATT00038012001 [Paramecium tetraurelia]CAK69572.1 unnamed protein product [Paramecium tetraurelia]|eukprot:XP_001436969.1 hypothetical protein (macronuclear) [Paramecium tetraurelia strain d4-2]
MHLQTFLEEPQKLSSYKQLQHQGNVCLTTLSVNEQKEQKVKSDIQSLEHIWVEWLGQQQMSQKQNDENQKKNESIDVECTQETNIGEKSAQLKTFFEILKSRIINEKLYSTMTQTQMTQFFEEASTQIQNKIKLYEDIQKLKLLQNYPTNTKRTYSKSANMILKKWLMENYNNPYPKPNQVEQLVQQTNLTNKQVLNWFINARNSLKNKSNQEKKFKHIVECKFKEFAIMKKKKLEQSI